MFCSWLALRFSYRHRNILVRFVHTDKRKVVGMSSLLSSIYLLWICYFVFLKTDQWCKSHFLSQKYWIYSFFAVFYHNIFTDISEEKQFDTIFTNIHSLLLLFRNGKTEKICWYFINYCHCNRWCPVIVGVVGIPVLLLKSLLLFFSSCYR